MRAMPGVFGGTARPAMSVALGLPPPGWDGRLLEREMSGYGRVPISPDGEVMKVRKIRTTDAEWEKCLKLSNGAGRSAFLRHAINTTELPKRAKAGASAPRQAAD